MSDFYDIWCDGACCGNGRADGVASYGVVISHSCGREKLSGLAPGGTNNIGELFAAIVALQHTPEKSIVTVSTDSKYVRNGITQWITNWKRNGWRTKEHQAVKNKELWVELDKLNSARFVTWKWVPGHAGIPENEMADMLAVAAIEHAKFGAIPPEKFAVLKK